MNTLYTGIGRPELSDFNRAMASAQTLQAVKRIVESAVGKSDLLEFLRLDLGAIVNMGASGIPCRIVTIIARNPLIMRQMTQLIPDAGSYAPISLLVYQVGGEVHVCYDQLASILEAFNSKAALRVATDLDKKVVELIKRAVT